MVAYGNYSCCGGARRSNDDIVSAINQLTKNNRTNDIASEAYYLTQYTFLKFEGLNRID